MPVFCGVVRGLLIPGNNLADGFIHSGCIIMKGFPKIKLGLEYHRLFMPYPGYHRAAKFAFVARQVIGGDKISPALDQQLFAVMAIGVVAWMAGHIADIGIMQALLHGQFPIAGQGGHRGGGQTIQLVAREKAQKVQGVSGADIV